MIYVCQAPAFVFAFVYLSLYLPLSFYMPLSLFFVFAIFEGQAGEPRTFISIEDLWQDFVLGFFFQSSFAIVPLLGLGQANE